jgi:hypothetical protein
MINDEATTHDKQGTVGVQVEPIVRFFRCGCCGQATDESGMNLSFDEVKSMNVDWNKAEMTNGNCCATSEQEIYMRQVTREMALDAGCPEIEGTLI